MRTPDEIAEIEHARMDRLMQAFDEAVNEPTGFGFHSLALVALVGLSRVTEMLRRQFVHGPRLNDQAFRTWMDEQIQVIDDFVERLDVEESLRALAKTSGIPGSTTWSITASFIEHLARRHWIELDSEAKEISVFGTDE